VLGKLVLPINMVGDRGDMLSRKRIDLLSQHVNGFAQPETKWLILAVHNTSASFLAQTQRVEQNAVVTESS